MKKTIMAVTALVFVGALASVEVVPTETKLTNCENLGKVQAGDRFAGLDRETAIKAVKEEAKAMNANKVFLELTSYNHPKLGKQYIAKASAWKCN
jgi:uncharacterized protein YbjQ (UPF0145 family)